MYWAVMLAALLVASEPLCAGAWTIPHGTLQVFSGAVSSHAHQRYDGTGKLVGPVFFNKLYFQNWMEYGLTDAFTLIAAPQYITAKSSNDKGLLQRFSSPSLEAGGKLLLSRRFGMLSLQATAKAAGGFDMSVSSSGESGRQIELRLLYGANFKLFQRDGFIDLEAGQRWIQRPRPDEMVLDASMGWWLTRRNLILLQSFTAISGKGPRWPYEPYCQVKLEGSMVHRFTPRWALQSGYFITAAGRNTVKENGMVTTLWFRL